MGYRTLPSTPGNVWSHATRQHGVVTHGQLAALGYSDQAIKYRLARGRFHSLFRGVMPSADVAPREVTRQRGIPVTRPAVAIVDAAPSLTESALERMINEADQQHVVHFDVLLEELQRMPKRPGAGVVKRLVLRHSFRLTRSELERLFLALVSEARLPLPQTRAVVEDFEVDFWFPELGIVVEADSLAYHRTPAKQLQDRLRDQAHLAAGLTPLRFTHWQIAKEPGYVIETLRRVASVCRSRASARPTRVARA